MTSSTRNVKLGICRVTFGGVDLGLTKGGVDVTIKTDTQKVQVDQFGTSTVAEYIKGRDITVKVPLAESTVDNFIRVMPGTSSVTSAGVEATGSFAFSAQPAAGDYISLNGLIYKFVTAGSTSGLSSANDGAIDPAVSIDPANQEVVIGANLAATLTALQSQIAASLDARAKAIVATTGTGTLTITYATTGLDGNAFLLGASGAAITVTAMSGGTADLVQANVGTGLGTSLLATAKQLVLHPTALPDTDQSDDLTIPLANTNGSVNYAYAIDKERIYSVEFMGYPDPLTQLLFFLGPPNAGV